MWRSFGVCVSPSHRVADLLTSASTNTSVFTWLRQWQLRLTRREAIPKKLHKGEGGMSSDGQRGLQAKARSGDPDKNTSSAAAKTEEEDMLPRVRSPVPLSILRAFNAVLGSSCLVLEGFHFAALDNIVASVCKHLSFLSVLTRGSHGSTSNRGLVVQVPRGRSFSSSQTGRRHLPASSRGAWLRAAIGRLVPGCDLSGTRLNSKTS